MIDSYSFGKITIDGRTYTSDVIIYPGRVDASWRRKVGHSLYPEDIRSALKARPDILVIGTGYAGIMTVPNETLDVIASHGVEARVERTGKAVVLFNDLQAQKKTVIAALHITC